MITIKEATPITKEEFITYITRASHLYNRYQSLQALYANDETFLGYDTTHLDDILSLLSELFLLPKNENNETVLHYYAYKAAFGAYHVPGAYIDEKASLNDTSHRAPELTTMEDLYLYVAYVYNRERNIQ